LFEIFFLFLPIMISEKSRLLLGEHLTQTKFLTVNLQRSKIKCFALDFKDFFFYGKEA